jgi:hypothetical protein
MALVSKRTGSPESWHIVERWLKNCLLRHPACNLDRQESASVWYPTRLLDLGAPNTALETVRVVPTAENWSPGLDDKYTTLSHRWGSAKFLRLTESNLAQLKDGISIYSLSQTFQDAALVTKRMGVRYLWIDSLCILQDQEDLSDWLVESTRMDKVYTRSFCNISATATTDDTIAEGLFRSRQTSLGDSAILRLSIAGFQSNLETGHISCKVIYSRLWEDNVHDTQINGRGWVLQERLLAPRVLHFGRDQLFWECCRKEAAECYPYQLPGEIKDRSDLSAKYFKRYAAQVLLNPKEPYKGADYRRWGVIIENFSRARLSNPEDKLIAISGLAKKFQSNLPVKDRYVAGMWESNLQTELLWRAESEHDLYTPDQYLRVRPREYRAPTWSWASLDAAIKWGFDNAHLSDKPVCNIDIVEYKLEYRTDDDTGIITQGHLDLKGRLRRIQIILEDFDGGNGGKEKFLRITVNGDIIETDSERWPRVCLDIAQTSFEDDNINSRLYCLEGKGAEGFRNTAWLLLRVLNSEQGIFQRIGLVRERHRSIPELDADQSGQDGYPCREYTDGLHTIRII